MSLIIHIGREATPLSKEVRRSLKAIIYVGKDESTDTLWSCVKVGDSVTACEGLSPSGLVLPKFGISVGSEMRRLGVTNYKWVHGEIYKWTESNTVWDTVSISPLSEEELRHFKNNMKLAFYNRGTIRYGNGPAQPSYLI